jgi:flavin-dependent dehydrogenase
MILPPQPDVVVAGGGLTGAAAAIRLAALGREVLVLERSRAPRWTACGVFTAAPREAWRELGLDGPELGRLGTPIPAFRLLAPGGAIVELTYGATPEEPVARGLDRPRIDERLLELAVAAGATVCRGSHVVGVEPDRRGRGVIVAVESEGQATRLSPRVLIGADGVRSTVARSLGLEAPAPIARRIALTFHVADRRGRRGEPRDGWMAILPGGYCGLAPVPGGRLNVGIVLDMGTWAGTLRRDGASVTVRQILRSLRLPPGAGIAVADEAPLDQVAGIVPVAHAVRRVAGDGWLLAGDAAGFLDPLTGEGIGRALGTAELAARAADDTLSGDPTALARYAEAVGSRYRARDRLSRLVQRFLDRPRLFDYAARRLASRRKLRATLDLVLADRLPAGAALDPRYLGAVLRP